MLLTAFTWLAGLGYHLDVGGFFWGALGGVTAWLVVAKRFGRGLVFHNVTNTALLLIIALGVSELVTGRRDPSVAANRPKLPEVGRPYSYEVARGNPLIFRDWWAGFVREWEKLFRAVKMPDPARRLPFRLRPGSSMMFMRSRIEVNSLGFRDREFPREKGDAFRIVALGESTTMGVTLEPEDRPWPAALEERIREHLPADRPVEVINAGVAAYTLADGLVRLRKDVLPLEPDLIISYHGYNGFKFLRGAPVGLRENPPRRESRPSRLLLEIEYRMKLRAYRERALVPDLAPPEVIRLEEGARESRYAELYGELIALARDHGIPLVLASFNMAVNPASHPDVIDFYRGGFPAVMFSIQANRVHNTLIAALAREHDGVHFIDTSAGLDGVHGHYIDLVHFTQPGREILAGNLFEGILPVLQEHPGITLPEPGSDGEGPTSL